MSTETVISEGSTGRGHRIVVGVDGSPESMRAVDWAAAEADRRGAVLDIRTAYEPGYEFITHEEVQRTMERLVDEVEARVAEVAPGVRTSSGTAEASPAAVLIEASDGADLLVVGSRGRGGFTGLLLGSVSQQCSLHSRCPIAIVR